MRRAKAVLGLYQTNSQTAPSKETTGAELEVWSFADTLIGAASRARPSELKRLA